MRLTKAHRRALQNMVACGFSTADHCGVSETTMRRLVTMGLACEPAQGRVRGSLDSEYGITQAGRAALNINDETEDQRTKRLAAYRSRFRKVVRESSGVTPSTPTMDQYYDAAIEATMAAHHYLVERTMAFAQPINPHEPGQREHTRHEE